MPLVPILGILFNGYMMYKLGWINWARLIIWLAIGLVIYFSYGRHHSRLQQQQAPEPVGKSMNLTATKSLERIKSECGR